MQLLIMCKILDPFQELEENPRSQEDGSYMYTKAGR